MNATTLSAAKIFTFVISVLTVTIPGSSPTVTDAVFALGVADSFVRNIVIETSNSQRKSMREGFPPPLRIQLPELLTAKECFKIFPTVSRILLCTEPRTNHVLGTLFRNQNTPTSLSFVSASRTANTAPTSETCVIVTIGTMSGTKENNAMNALERVMEFFMLCFAPIFGETFAISIIVTFVWM